MKFENEDFAYYLTPDRETEALIGLKKYFNEYIKEYMDTDFPNKEIPESSRFMSSKILGTLMFYLLQRDDIEYDENTRKHIKYFEYYLNKCVENKDFCDNKIFLSCMQECLSFNLPESYYHINDIYELKQLKDYKIIHSNLREKTDLVYKNKDKISFSKIYQCKAIEDLFICSLYELFEKKYIIRKCENCGKFFVTKEKGNRVKYCYNISPNDTTKTCYVYKSRETTEYNRKNNPRINVYAQITGCIRNRKSRAKTQEEADYFDNKLVNLSMDLEKYKKQIKENELTEEDVIKHFEEYKKWDKENWKLEFEEWRAKNGSQRTNKK